MEKNSQPLVSIVIPCYNHEKFVQDSIQSVIDQTYENIELIIIDDGSKDNSVEKIQQMISACTKRFTRFEFRSRPNKGLSATLNEALDWCIGEYYSAIASDDIYMNDKVMKQVIFLKENSKVIAVFGGIQTIDCNGGFLSSLNGSDLFYTFDQIILHKHILYAPTQMIKLKHIKEIGGYKNDMIIEDWYMWLKLSQIGDLYCMSEILCKYRIHDDNTSRKNILMFKGRLQVLNEFRDSKYYKKAIKEINWMGLIDLYGKKINLKILSFLFKNPIWFFNKIYLKFIKSKF